jgi:hypothetical protein
MEIAYVILGVLIFLAQLQNGFFTAILAAVFWPLYLIWALISMLYLMFVSKD